MSTLVATPTLTFTEAFGLKHEAQILEIQLPSSDCPALVDLESGASFPLQRSAVDPERAFLLLELAPGQALELMPGAEAPQIENAVRVVRQGDSVELFNGRVAVQMPLGQWNDGGGTHMVPGPVQCMRALDDLWRGRTFLDTRAKVSSRRGWVVEEGPLRSVAVYRVEMEDACHYQCTVTLDADQIFAHVEEEWEMGPADQIVWDFTGADFPRELLLLDSTPGYARRKIGGQLDQRHARLWCWTQQSQLHDLSDGFALKMGEEMSSPVVGFVTLEGGKWRGNRLNHMEAWTRRWWQDDFLTRRGQAPDAKADTTFAADAIPARGNSQTSAHFEVEGWLVGKGRRSFALVLASETDICPPARLQDAGHQAHPQHFQNIADRERYLQEQSGLRRLHIQRGVFPLAEVLGVNTTPESGAVTFVPGRAGYLSPWAQEHLRYAHADSLEEQKEWLLQYLEARVYGFWEGGGLAHTNPVSSRAIAPALWLFEYLCANGHLTGEEERQCRGHLLFLATLFFQENCYPGDITMSALGAPDGVEPTLAGMANQNFFTDIFNTYGLAAQVFSDHPQAPAWAEAFGRHWARQLEFHTYPESGMWEESHTYYLHVLHTILPTCLRRRDDGTANDFANPRFQRMVGAALLQITPSDATCQGRRHLVAFGDHHVDVDTYAYLFRDLAFAFASEETELAGRCAWLYREMNGTDALPLAPVPVQWVSGPVQGLGYFFRTTSEESGQNLLALRSGGAWAHHHHDEGSIQFFAYGRALIVDAAFGHVPQNSRRKFVASGHSRWSLEGNCPFNFFWRFNRGEIVEHAQTPRPFATALDPVVMTTPTVMDPVLLQEPITHKRRVTQLGPTTFEITDECDSTLPQVARFHLPLTEFTVFQGGIEASYAATEHSPAVVLRILCADGQTPVLGETDAPERPGLRQFTTREVTFSCRNGSKFLVCAQAPEMAFHAGKNAFEGAGWKWPLP